MVRSSHPARRALTVLAVAASVVLGALAGCGVGETSRPKDEGDAAVDANVVGGGDLKAPREVTAITAAREVVPAFFDAAAGAESDGREVAIERARDFLTSAARKNWKPGQDLTIVRIVGGIGSPVASGDVFTVTVRFQRIGMMTPEGPVTELGDQRQEKFTFEIASEDGRWHLTRAPGVLMIRDTALQTFYRPNPIYFWDLSRTRLVPDLRYLPLTMPAQQRPSQVVRWLLQGPSPWLRSTVSAFRRDTSLKSPVQSTAGAVTVNLSSNAVDDTDEARRQLTYQLRWSLRPYAMSSLELQIEGQTKATDASESYLSANMAAAQRQPELFVLDKGKVVVANSSPPVPGELAVLGAEANTNVTYAAISTDHSMAAYVTRQGDADALTLVRVTEDRRLRERAVRGLPKGASIGRPAWISGSGGHLLVRAQGRLYAVPPSGSASLVAPTITGVTSVSVAPDGRRVAFVAHGRAYVTGLAVDPPSITLGSPRGVVPSLTEATAVAWISEDRVLVAGASGTNAALFEVSADGAVAEDRSPTEQALVDIVAYPDSPVGGGAAADIVAQTETNVIRLFGASPVVANDLVSPFYAGG